MFIYIYIYPKIFYEHTGHRHTYIGYIFFFNHIDDNLS